MILIFYSCDYFYMLLCMHMENSISWVKLMRKLLCLVRNKINGKNQCNASQCKIKKYSVLTCQIRIFYSNFFISKN